jgi:hypothetical protein
LVPLLEGIAALFASFGLRRTAWQNFEFWCVALGSRGVELKWIGTDWLCFAIFLNVTANSLVCALSLYCS